MIHFKKKDNASDLPYRPGVGLMIINSDNKIFIGKRIDSKLETWQMPQGGIDLGETPSSAAIREMKEEIGTNNGIIIAESKYWYSYDVPKFLVHKLWNGKYRGQRQKWFLIRFKGEDFEININSFMPEFSDWRWVAIEELLEVVVAFKKDLYQAVIKEFKSILRKEKIII